MKYGTQMESYHQVWTWIPTRGRLTLRMWRFKRQPLLLYSWVAVKAHHHQHLSMETSIPHAHHNYCSTSSLVPYQLGLSDMWHCSLHHVQQNHLYHLFRHISKGILFFIFLFNPRYCGPGPDHCACAGWVGCWASSFGWCQSCQSWWWRWWWRWWWWWCWLLIEDVCRFQEWCR